MMSKFFKEIRVIMKTFRFALIPALLLIFCQPAMAVTKAGDATITFGGGYDYFSSKRHMKNSGIGFGEVGYYFTDQWGIEGLLGFFHTESRASSNYGQDVSGDMFAVNAVYQFTSCCNRVQPYVLAGPGIMGFNPNGSNAHQQGNINAAVGVKIFADELVAVRLEARDFYTFSGGMNDIFLNAGVYFLIHT